MYDILHQVTIEAPAEKVYAALTEQSGLAGWWTTHTKATPEEGTVSEFSFYGGEAVFKMEVKTLEPGKKVYWDVQAGVPDWADTRVTFDLSTTDTGTDLLFGHRNYANTDGSFATASYNWAWFLTSLKAYVETGAGTPHSD